MLEYFGKEFVLFNDTDCVSFNKHIAKVICDYFFQNNAQAISWFESIWKWLLERSFFIRTAGTLRISRPLPKKIRSSFSIIFFRRILWVVRKSVSEANLLSKAMPLHMKTMCPKAFTTLTFVYSSFCLISLDFFLFLLLFSSEILKASL